MTVSWVWQQCMDERAAGRVMDWDIGTGECRAIKNNSNAVLNLKLLGDQLVASTLDDKIRATAILSDEFKQDSGVAIEGPPKGLAVLGDLTIAASFKEVLHYRWLRRR